MLLLEADLPSATYTSRIATPELPPKHAGCACLVVALCPRRPPAQPGPTCWSTLQTSSWTREGLAAHGHWLVSRFTELEAGLCVSICTVCGCVVATPTTLPSLVGVMCLHPNKQGLTWTCWSLALHVGGKRVRWQLQWGVYLLCAGCLSADCFQLCCVACGTVKLCVCCRLQ